ncbi:hypothetical protein CY34DRAFT_744316 [Suillus luteus UH-Slu-Lm8-n1]|uniref:Uncharacterized protein n=1 Tax=Suillus luteus UH-Slu-Lm8-n1 TaxID=930992 RepID=A0A0D0AYU5_9AGAM|nr:hypothetical protein CY34DRAFT_744316 [Suillus luteus UH-Slu-Lm8-n1]
MKAFRDTYLTARDSPTYSESTNRNLDLAMVKRYCQIELCKISAGEFIQESLTRLVVRSLVLLGVLIMMILQLLGKSY